MLPLKLSQMENLANKRDRSSPQPGGYQRLSSNSFSPSTVGREDGGGGGSAPTHVRTGSSPAMMQPHATPPQPGAASALHTFPRMPAEKPRTSPPQQKAPRATEEEVIFF
jgi:hypothetical protein